jgi:hypothetical protein
VRWEVQDLERLFVVPVSWDTPPHGDRDLRSEIMDHDSSCFLAARYPSSLGCDILLCMLS